MSESLARWYAALMRVPAAGYFSLFLLLPALLTLGATLNPVRRHVIEPYLWRPIVQDTGYNPVSSLLLIFTAVVLLLWFLRLLRTYNQTVDMDWIFGVLPILVWGPMLRALEDSDLFAPFAQGLAVHDPSAKVTTPCSLEVPGSFLDQCLGVFLVTPPIWIWGCLLIFAWARMGRFAMQVEAQWGRRAALAFTGLLLGLHVLGHAALFAAQPSWVRFVPSPWLTLLLAIGGLALVAYDARRHQGVRSRRVLLACAVLPLGLTVPWVYAWLTGGVPGWRPDGTLRPWILLWLVLIPAALAWALRHHAKELSGRRRPARSPRKLLLFLLYVVVLEAFVLYDGVVRLNQGVERGQVQPFLLGAAIVAGAILLGVYVVRGTRKGTLGAHKSLATFLHPLALLAVAGQFADALMTSLSLDVYGLREKHVVPRALIASLESAQVPGAAALVMFLYKLPITLLAIWWLDRRFDRPGVRSDFNMLLKAGILAVGLVPGTRDALRLVMGV